MLEGDEGALPAIREAPASPPPAPAPEPAPAPATEPAPEPADAAQPPDAQVAGESGGEAGPERPRRAPRRTDSRTLTRLEAASLSRSKSKSRSSSSTAVSSDERSDAFTKLEHLQKLLSNGFISETEFQERREQLVDELTGTRTRTRTRTASSRTRTSQRVATTATTSSRSARKPRARRRSNSLADAIVIPGPPPPFSALPEERATRLEFDPITGQWTRHPTTVKLAPTPFARGALRLVYYMQDCGLDSAPVPPEEPAAAGATALPAAPAPAAPAAPAAAAATEVFVAKIACQDDMADEDYFRDAEMQAVCQAYARKFNSYSPPCRVEFVTAWLMQLDDRDGVVMGVERYIDGEYRKHNNNAGYVSESERNTPQAFSHYTFEASGHKLLVVDIQGVGDRYTDPQIHTISGRGFGKGNLGCSGFDKFLSTHRCNAICRYLRLPSVNPSVANVKVDGTLPAQPVMDKDRVDVIAAGELPRFAAANERSPLLPHDQGERTPACAWCLIL